MKRMLSIFTIAVLCNITITTNTKWYIAKSEEDLKCSIKSQEDANNCVSKGIVTCHTGVESKEECEMLRNNLADLEAQILKRNPTKWAFPYVGYKDMQCFEGDYKNIRHCNEKQDWLQNFVWYYMKLGR